LGDWFANYSNVTESAHKVYRDNGEPTTGNNNLYNPYSEGGMYDGLDVSVVLARNSAERILDEIRSVIPTMEAQWKSKHSADIP